MTFDERVRALEPFRFTPRQARFLVTVALHGGYCLRRQYTAFAGMRYGKVVRAFLDGLRDRGLATRESCRGDRGYLYHLYARSIYRALQQEDNRNRRQTSLAAIGRKLMLLDFVIAQPGADWFATEVDKVALFTQRFGVPAADLPQRSYAAYGERQASTTRYFVHKLPIFLAGEPPHVHFATLALEATGQPFEQFLRDHARVLSYLPAWTVVVVSPLGASGAPACRVVFDRFMMGGPSPAGSDRRELVRYFVTRRAVERNELAQLSVTDLNHFREARQRLDDPVVETRYARWLALGDRALAEPDAGTAARLAPRGRFITHPLPFTYEQFGDLAGVS
ncbi:MAG: hypothetical protein ABJA98_20665 [Acidobacteriota bacterium]